MKPSERIRELAENMIKTYPDAHKNMSSTQRIDLTIISMVKYLDEEYLKDNA